MESPVGTTGSSAWGRRRLLGAGVAGAAGAGVIALGTSPAAALDDAADQRTVYDVTKWRVSGRPGLTARQDIGAVINDIIADIKRRQPDRDAKPGAAIVIPPGDYDLRTPVVIDISFLTITGYGHGFNSLSIRYNVDTTGWVELQSRRQSHPRADPASTAAFTVRREAAPRLSGIVFRDFCLDGVSLRARPEQLPQRHAPASRSPPTTTPCTSPAWASSTSSVALVVRGADALRVHDNMIAECGSCVELTGPARPRIVSDNLMGAGPNGPTIRAENHEGLLVTGNNLFPRGRSLIELSGCSRSSITANRMQGFYPGMLRLVDSCKENLVTANHLRRGVEGFPPFLGVSNGLDDFYGVIHVRGDNNLISNNLFAFDVPPDQPQPVRRPAHDDPGGRGRRTTSSRSTTWSRTSRLSMSCWTHRPHDPRCWTAAAENEITAHTQDVAIRPTP